MDNCPHCGTAATSDDQFCRSCGQRLGSDVPAAMSDETVRWTGNLPLRRETRSSISLDTLFGQKTHIFIGRAPDCDVCLPHPSVSRVHAILERRPNGLLLSDYGSVNGTFVSGRRITEPVLIAERERVTIGPYLFSLSQGIITSLDSSRSLRLEARELERVVWAPGGNKKLLTNINLVIEPGQFVCLLGPSGSGKSTLMDALNGRRRATGGKVLANGVDFYQHFDSFRQTLGYVPQRDIVHSQLTVYRALYYTAQLRLPNDTAPAELRGRVDDVLREMELVPHKDTLIANLSGGQIKRVSLGAELLARPCMLYIDEATSGLDAGTEARMMRLFRALSEEGKSIICITHNIDNIDRCHLAAVLVRGRLAYFGPPAEAPAYFEVARLGEVYDRLAEKEPERWEKHFAASALHKKYIEDRQLPVSSDSGPLPGPVVAPQVGSSGVFGGLAANKRRDLLSAHLRRLTSGYAVLREMLAPVGDALWQFRVLTLRYAELLIGDRRSMGLLWLQAPLVAVFILLGFSNKPYDQPLAGVPQLDPQERKTVESLIVMGKDLENQTPDPKEWQQINNQPLPIPTEPQPTVGDVVRTVKDVEKSKMLDRMLEMQGIIDPRYNYMLLYMLVITVMWFGCNNAAKEIVKEEAIYGRERAVNLGISSYLGSKFLLLSIVSALQTFLLMGVVFGGLHLLHIWFGQPEPYPPYRLGFAGEFVVLTLLAMVGVAAGLLLSACVNSPDRASTLLPYVLIPQIILGGGLLSVNEQPLRGLAQVLSPVYWAFRGVHRGATTFPKDFPFHMDYDDSVWIACAALVVQMTVLLMLTAWFLRRKDAGRA